MNGARKAWADDARARRQAVADHLAAHGLLRRPRRLVAMAAETGDPRFAAKLRDAVADLGPLFQCFGRYLAARADLLAGRDCLVLDAIPDRASETAAPAPDATGSSPSAAAIARALGRPIDQCYDGFDEVPVAAGLIDRCHHARLHDGRAVTVRVACPDLIAARRRDTPSLGLLGPAFDEHLGRRAGVPRFAEVVADFERALDARLDFAGQAAALASLARETDRAELLVVPEVVPALCAPEVLTLVRIGGARFETGAGELAARRPAAAGATDRPTDRAADFATDDGPAAGGDEAGLGAAGEARGRDLARRLFLAWLQQALAGRMFPVEAEVVVLDDGRLAVTAGRFAHLPAASRSNLWDYLLTTAEHRPDDACARLQRELVAREPSASAADLELRLRQVVPFRDGGWSTRGDTVAEHLMVHWRLVRACGFEPRPHLADFFTGLFWAVRASRGLPAGSDPLRAALDDLRWIAGWDQWQQLVDPRRLGPSLEASLTGLLAMPQKLDQLLSAATGAGGNARPRAEEDSPAKRSARRSTDVAVAALAIALAMAAVAWTTVELAGRGAFEAVGTIVLSLLGARLLWLLWR